MSDQRPWYSNGCVVILVLLAALFLGPTAYRFFVQGRPPIAPLIMRAGIKYHLFTSPDFQIEVWHEHPGGLQNGSVEVEVISAALSAETKRQREVESFRDWPAGEANSKWFSFPVQRVDVDDVFRIESKVRSADTWAIPYLFRWRDGAWLQNKEPPAGS